MERKSLVVSGIQNPALRRDAVRLRHCGRAQSQFKAQGLWRGSNREHSKPKKKDGEGVLFFCVHREPVGSLCVSVRRRKAGGDFAVRNPKTHFAETPQAKTKSTPVGVLLFLVHLQGFRTPLCAGMRCGCGAAAGRKASPKPDGFGGVRIGNHDTKRKTSIDDGGFLLVHLQGFEPGTH